MNQNPYFVPACESVTEEHIKKSRFITYLAHVSNVDEAKKFVAQMKAMHPDARHHCWAFVAGHPNDSMCRGFSDDGEPSGTAGKPILAQLIGSGLGEIVAVVVRYYGGVRLGTGGLVKAYGGGVKLALENLRTIEKVIVSKVQFEFEYQHLSLVTVILESYHAAQISTDFTDNIVMIVEVDVRKVSDLCLELTNRLRARLTVTMLDNN